MSDLIAVAHGTADPRGIRVVHELVRLMARQRPDIPMSLGFVDVDLPALPDLTRRVVADSNHAVLVPLLLSTGYHVTTDLGNETLRHHGKLTSAPALGPDPVLADILATRLQELPPRAVFGRVDHVVLAAAGSSDVRALADCVEMGRLVGERIDRPVTVGYVSGVGRRLPEVLRETRGRLAVASYLLAPGFFHSLVRRYAGGRPVSEPLGADPRLAALALRRYDEAESLLTVSARAGS
ncbi:CbiX/SirB N-terminal domain-containing protein [Kribbella sp. NPDC026611]|uniref:sirohydrochlorin chelatase n=1 Tax=Kribbella sp. NPDC026611 TaxID=3154911 RepID=UPI0033FB5B20